MTFAGAVRGKGGVWVRVCRSAKRDKRGLICDGALDVRAKRHGSRFTVSPAVCDRGAKDCRQEGPVQPIEDG